MRRTDEALRGEVLDLHERGYSPDEVAFALHVPVAVVLTILGQNGVPVYDPRVGRRA